MRSGKLLAQSKPGDLITAYNVTVSCNILGNRDCKKKQELNKCHIKVHGCLKLMEQVKPFKY